MSDLGLKKHYLVNKLEGSTRMTQCILHTLRASHHSVRQIPPLSFQGVFSLAMAGMEQHEFRKLLLASIDRLSESDRNHLARRIPLHAAKNAFRSQYKTMWTLLAAHWHGMN